MKRRFFHVMFWIGNIACALVIAGAMMALGPPQSLPDVHGVWDGFYLAADGTTGRIDSNFAQEDSRRLTGDGTLYDLGNEDLSYSLRATMARPDFIAGTGETRTGRLTYHASLETYTGRGGDAGVLSPQYHLIPSQGEES